jgi:hypothetical protein
VVIVGNNLASGPISESAVVGTGLYIAGNTLLGD